MALAKRCGAKATACAAGRRRQKADTKSITAVAQPLRKAPGSARSGRGEGAVVRATETTKSGPLAEWKGAKLQPLALTLGTGAAVALVPTPAGVTSQAWNLLSIFVASIIGIITQPLPLGAVALISLGVTMVTGTLPFASAFSAFSSEIPWLIALSFFLARGFIKTGLGNRIAYIIVSAFGKSTLGLTYSLVFSEALFAPAIPSLAARSGGIFVPLACALCESCGSSPSDGTQRKMGSYVMLTMFQTSCVTSGMFITAMAANPLMVNLAAPIIGHTITWGEWASAASLPGLICLLAVPALLYVFYPPEVKDSPEAPTKAREELSKLGAMTFDEKVMSGALLVTVGLWIFGGKVGIGAVAAALVGLTTLLSFGVLTWSECLRETNAWNTLTWFAALIAMASQLNKLGLIPYLATQVVNLMNSMSLGWQSVFTIVSLIYFYSHYTFASAAAHISCMASGFLSICVNAGTPGIPAALTLGWFSNLMGCITHFGIGSAPPFYGTGYVDLGTWWKAGAGLSLLYIIVFGPIGFIWTRLILPGA